MAAATPIAGAPRITIFLIASITWVGVLQTTKLSLKGSFRWSIMITWSSCQAIVGIMEVPLQ
jgi:hypothetical protein